MESSFALMVLFAPLLLVLIGTWLGRRESTADSMRVYEIGAWIGSMVSIASAVAVVMHGPITTSTLGYAELGISLRLDALSVTLFMMVTLLAIVILRFSRSYLDGDPRHHLFMRRIALTVAAVEVLLIAGNLVVFVAAWIATSWLLHGLLLFYPQRRGAQNAARKKFIVARMSEFFLIAACALLYVHLGTGDIGTILVAASEPTFTLGTAAILLALAALTKSAQFPLHSWLLEVMETPTPVSALLHAGILNAGPYLLLRFASVFEVSVWASALVIVVGGFTALFASIALMTQPAVKTSLAYSSAAHMGFSLLLCGFGVYAAAALHLVAHSFYKAHAFLSTGSAVDRRTPIRAPHRLRKSWRILTGVALALAIYLGVATVLGLSVTADLGLLTLGAVVVMGIAQLVAPAFDSRIPGVALVQASLLGAVVAVAFFSLETLSQWMLGSALPARTNPDSALIVLSGGVLAIFGATTIVQLTKPTFLAKSGRIVWVHVKNGLYVNILLDRWMKAYSTQKSR